MKSCLKCGSTDIITGMYGGDVFLKCKECGHMSTLVVDFPDESLKKMKAMEKSIRLEKKASKRMEGRV
jgi:uncharacterized Zn finger protein